MLRRTKHPRPSEEHPDDDAFALTSGVSSGFDADRFGSFGDKV
jgi:hypothetical protein